MVDFSVLITSGCVEAEQQAAWLALYAIQEKTGVPLADVIGAIGGENDPGSMEQAGVNLVTEVSNAAAYGCDDSPPAYTPPAPKPIGFTPGNAPKPRLPVWVDPEISMLDQVHAGVPFDLHAAVYDPGSNEAPILDEADLLVPVEDGVVVQGTGIGIGGPPKTYDGDYAFSAETATEAKLALRGTVSMAQLVPQLGKINAEIARYNLLTNNGVHIPAYMTTGYITSWGQMIPISLAFQTLQDMLAKKQSKAPAWFNGQRGHLKVKMGVALRPWRQYQRAKYEDAQLTQAIPLFLERVPLAQLELLLRKHAGEFIVWDPMRQRGQFQTWLRGGKLLFLRGTLDQLRSAGKSRLREVTTIFLMREPHSSESRFWLANNTKATLKLMN